MKDGRRDRWHRNKPPEDPNLLPRQSVSPRFAWWRIEQDNRQPANPRIGFIGRSRIGEKRNHLLGRDLLRVNLKTSCKLQKLAEDVPQLHQTGDTFPADLRKEHW